MQVCGFSQKIPKVIDTLIDCLRNLKNKVTEKQFYTIRENNLKKYENIFLSPTVLVTEFTWSLIDHNRATIIDRYKKLATISFEDFKNFEETFFTQIKLKVLMQGNLTENDARDNITNVLARLEASKIEDVSYILNYYAVAFSQRTHIFSYFVFRCWNVKQLRFHWVCRTSDANRLN